MMGDETSQVASREALALSLKQRPKKEGIPYVASEADGLSLAAYVMDEPTKTGASVDEQIRQRRGDSAR